MRLDRQSLPPVEVTDRLPRLREQLSEAGVEAAYITTASNIRWCTGFTGSSSALVMTPTEAVLLTDSRYAQQAPDELAAAGCEAEVEITANLHAAARDMIDTRVALGLEAAVAWGEQRRWADDHLGDLVPLSEIVEQLRAVKDGAELARIEAAASVVDDSLAELSDHIVEGRTERELARRLDDAMLDRGAMAPAYDTIVASGPNAALPHARPGERVLRSGDLVIIDAGALIDGYRSDMTRTFVLGPPSDRAARLLDLVTAAQAAGVEAVGPGVAAETVDTACRAVIEAAGLGDAFGHGTGHGVGLDIHELPRVARGSTAILRPGHVITVEPGVYLPGFGGVRVEDSLVVTAAGCRPLTRYPKNPVVT